MGLRTFLTILFSLSLPALANESETARRLRGEILQEAYNLFSRNPTIESLLHYPNGYSNPKYPCADFVTWILEATAGFPKRPNNPLIVVQARSNYKYVIDKMGWKVSGTYDLKELPRLSENLSNPRPQGCLAYYFKRAKVMNPINIRHVAVVYTANSYGMKVIDASGYLGKVVYRDANDEILVKEGGYAKLQIVCPP